MQVDGASALAMTVYGADHDMRVVLMDELKAVTDKYGSGGNDIQTKLAQSQISNGCITYVYMCSVTFFRPQLRMCPWTPQSLPYPRFTSRAPLVTVPTSDTPSTTTANTSWGDASASKGWTIAVTVPSDVPNSTLSPTLMLAA